MRNAAPYTLLAWALGLLFIGLKLTEEITWSWLWVLSPFWIPPAFVGGVIVGVLIFWGLAKIVRLLTTTKEEREHARRLRNARQALDDYADVIIRGRR